MAQKSKRRPHMSLDLDAIETPHLACLEDRGKVTVIASEKARVIHHVEKD